LQVILPLILIGPLAALILIVCANITLGLGNSNGFGQYGPYNQKWLLNKNQDMGDHD